MAATDVLSLEEGKRALHMPESVSTLDEAISDAISDVSEFLVEMCGPIVATEVAERFTVDGDRISFGYPIIEVTSVVEYSGTSSSTVTDTGYLLVNNTGVDAHLLRRSGGVPFAWRAGSLAVGVEVVAGRAEDTESVPQRFKSCARKVLRAGWRQDAASWHRTPQFDPEAEYGDPAADPAVIVRSMLRRDLLIPGIA